MKSNINIVHTLLDCTARFCAFDLGLGVLCKKSTKSTINTDIRLLKSYIYRDGDCFFLGKVLRSI